MIEMCVSKHAVLVFDADDDAAAAAVAVVADFFSRVFENQKSDKWFNRVKNGNIGS